MDIACSAIFCLTITISVTLLLACCVPIKPYSSPVQFLVTLLLCILATAGTHAFSLLGPHEDWQTPTLGYNPFGEDRGAPKNLGEEYRWNLPVITYGFDRAFMDYFGLQ